MNAIFKDLNFKLCAIEELMYSKNLLTPKFDVYDFARGYKDREIDIDEEGYEIIPEVLAYFEQLEIPEELLVHVTEIYQDGGNKIYMSICPFWNGDDDWFNITSSEDVAIFPNLKKMTIFSVYGGDHTLRDELKAKGINVEYL